MPRTDEEIVARIHDLADRGADIEEQVILLTYLPFRTAKLVMKAEPQFRSDVNEPAWEQESRIESVVLSELSVKIACAWSAANRGNGPELRVWLSYLRAYLWLLGEGDAADGIEDVTHFGKPALRAICEHYGWLWRELDDGCWQSNLGSEGGPPLPAMELRWNAPRALAKSA